MSRDRAGDDTGPADRTGNGLPAPDLLSELEAWAADARVHEAAAARARERWLRQQAEESATLLGQLIDLAERNITVVVSTRSGRRHRGHVVAVGTDFVALRSEATQVLVAIDAIATVRTLPEVRAVIGDRVVAVSLELIDVLLGLAADRPRVVIGAADADAVAGELRSVGTDVVTVRCDGPQPAPVAYIPIGSITEVTLER